ncbi:Short chain dehydrogenase yanD [Fusarium oxysporum f. sp. raphani]|uniref:Short chain dehydrogenase yanD n=1 Tax=Fusarium oxysporum f. sp. raphani TaxID=96318 RepID=A0A8J5PTJ4_FUSOX|nr:Short chain dehydrogenase yanD [Fusarium oxysporum f. sp. raphani]
MAELLREIRAKWIPEPLPPRDSFEGQTVLVTGGTGGLGLATAKHFANLGAAKVIITYRDKSRGEAARQEIEAAARATGRERVVIETMELDLSRYSSCISFVEELLRRTNGIDVVVLNAGTFNSSFIMSPDGWEETIQANTLSTALLAILLIKWMKAGRQNRQTPASLVFVSSGRHLTPDISEWPEWEKREGGILLHYKNASNWPSDSAVDAMYATSKLLVMYVFEEICKLAVDAKGE